MSSSTTTKRYGILRVLAYIAVLCVGIALLISAIFKQVGGFANIVTALRTIAECLAYLVIACYSFNYARSRGLWWLIAWVVAIVLIVISVVWGLI